MNIETANDIAGKIVTELGKALVGQEEVIEQTVVALIAGGHTLLEGVPGTGKTLLARALSFATGTSFNRIQFTPDLMPSDIVGVNIYDMVTKEFEFRAGPVFCDILLADEINRAPAKTQSALLEAMQERQATVDGKPYPMSPVFTVLATQNPVEFEGTYPLPEAQ
ncbi:MAG: AAA family ATPase, partial [Phycisphaerales bacterium]